jgi:carbonic anhydrase/acetyltransferase-like protein (isoleucine patch superfamily)
MPTSDYLKPFPLFLEKPLCHADALEWLKGQPEDVRRVTYVDPDGVLMQKPVIEEGTYVDPSAFLIGGMILRSGCYIGPQAVIRLDENNVAEPLILGVESNIQDFALVHSNTTKMGERVIVAHQAIVHGAIIEDDVALYIQAVADGGGTVIGRGSFLNQGSYVGKGVKVPAGRHVEPGRIVLTQAEADALPAVPEAVEEVRLHVLELNRLHVKRHLELGCAPDSDA